MKYQRLILITLLGAVLATGLITGCQKRSLEGNAIAPVPPMVNWADVQIDPIFHRSANLRWFSTDKDGIVLDYQFTVLLKTTVDSLAAPDTINAPDVAARLLEHDPSIARWTIVRTDSASIPLVASADTGEYIEQYIFLRAMDDDSLFSSIIYRYVSRNNHPPTCYVIVPFTGTAQRGHPEPQWCLPETTTTWHGIRVAWVGKDSIDVPGMAPDFDWNVRIYGPFVDSLGCWIDHEHPDTLAEHMLVEFTDSTGSVWIRDKEKYLTNLETGWYFLYARNRDDAFVSSVPALGFLNIYEPRWIRYTDTKPILLVNHILFYPDRAPFPTGGDLTAKYRDSLIQFYNQMMDSAGYASDQYDWFDAVLPNGTKIPVDKSLLANHRLVVAVASNKASPFLKEQEDAYKLYLEVGGMLWIIGRRSFDAPNAPGQRDFGLNDAEHPLAYPYLNLSAIYSGPTGAFAAAEFVGASSLIDGFPDIAVATERIFQTSDSLHTPRQFYRDALSCVDRLIRLNDSETIYNFRAINPDTGSFHNMPVAVRWDKGTWKTSYYSFPLYFIQTEHAAQVTRGMLDWFFADRR